MDKPVVIIALLGVIIFLLVWILCAIDYVIGAIRETSSVGS